MDIIPLAFVPDFQLDDEGQIVWEHVVFPLDSGGAVGMTSRVPCAPGLFFSLGVGAANGGCWGSPYWW